MAGLLRSSRARVAGAETLALRRYRPSTITSSQLGAMICLTLPAYIALNSSAVAQNRSKLVLAAIFAS